MKLKFLGNAQHRLAKTSAKIGRVAIYQLETKGGAGELFGTPVQACRDAVTIVEGGMLPADNVPKRRSTTERVGEKRLGLAVTYLPDFAEGAI